MGFSIDRFEKAHYPFKRYPRKNCETILFPGCAFPSQFPQTMDCLAEICTKNGIGIAYDCCGVSVAGHNGGKDSDRIIESIGNRLKRLGCKRLACMCPNCYFYLSERLDIELISAYQLLAELGVEQETRFEDGALFVPCPDRKERVIEGSLRESFDLGALPSLAKGCCGLRPDIVAKGSDLAKKCGTNVANSVDEGVLYTYCASCSGQFKRLGFEGVRHVLPEILGTSESPDAAHAIMNRAKRKFDKNVDPLK